VVGLEVEEAEMDEVEEVGKSLCGDGRLSVVV